MSGRRQGRLERALARASSRAAPSWSAGAALLCDLDTTDSRLAHALGALTQRALNDLGHGPRSDELAGRIPTLFFEHINPLAPTTFSTDRPAGQLRRLRAASAA